MKSSMRIRVGVGLAALTCFLHVFASVAFAVKIDATMQSLRLQASDDTQTRPKGLGGFKAGASAGWGLWMESGMAFINSDAVLDPTMLNLEWRESNGSRFPAVAMADGANRVVLVVFDAFSEEDALRLALWVAGSKTSIPFSAPPIGHPARELLKKQDYQPPTHGFTRLEDSPVRMEKYQPTADALLLVHPVLDTPALVQAMGYIDFSDRGERAPATPMVVVRHTDSERIVGELNALEDVAGSGTSYTNADLHSKFKCDLATGKVLGTPLRYYWSHDNGGNIRFHLAASFIEPASLPKDRPEDLEARQREAIELFRLASVFSAFAEKNKAGLLRFIDEAFARAER